MPNRYQQHATEQIQNMLARNVVVWHGVVMSPGPLPIAHPRKREARSRVSRSRRDLSEMQKELYDILSEHTGQPYETIDKDCDRDNWMRAPQAKEYGLIDEVLSRSNPRKKEDA